MPPFSTFFPVEFAKLSIDLASLCTLPKKTHKHNQSEFLMTKTVVIYLEISQIEFKKKSISQKDRTKKTYV